MADIKLIITDLDDTFLDGAYAPDMNVAAITHAREQGIIVLPCTGRSWIMAEDVIRGYDFDDHCVVCNGAAIMQVSTGTVSHHNPLDAGMLQPLLRIAADNSVGFEVICGDHLAMLRKPGRVKRGREYDERLAALRDSGKLAVFESPEALAEGCADIAELVRLFLCIDDEAAPDVEQGLAGLPGVEYARSYRLHLDVMAKGINKGSALLVLAGMYGIKPENIMALGDQMNDAPMLQAAGLGVAMGNADEGLKVLADCVTDTNKNAGFAKAVYQHAL